MTAAAASAVLPGLAPCAAATEEHRRHAELLTSQVASARAASAWAKTVRAALARGTALSRLSASLPREEVGGMAAAAGLRLACRRGCAACCAYAVAASPLEVLNLAGYLRATRTEAELGALRRRLAARIAGADQADRAPDGSLLGWGSPCALLSEDGACSVYRHRPLACVGYNSLDAAACEDPGGRHPFYGPQEHAARVIEVGTSVGAELAGLDGAPLELTLGLAAALADPQIEAKWRRGEDVFAAARVVHGPGLLGAAWAETRALVRRRLPVLRGDAAPAAEGGEHG